MSRAHDADLKDEHSNGSMDRGSESQPRKKTKRSNKSKKDKKSKKKRKSVSSHSSTSGSSRSSSESSRSASRTKKKTRRHTKKKSKKRSRRHRKRSPTPSSRSRSYYSRSRSYYSDYSRSRSRGKRLRSDFRPRERRDYGYNGGYRERLGYSEREARENPDPNKILGCFGLSNRTTEGDLRREFSRYGKIDDVVLITDRDTGQSRGFGFIYFTNVDDATDAKNAMTGTELDGRIIRVDYSITKRPHDPTSGQYM